MSSAKKDTATKSNNNEEDNNDDIIEEPKNLDLDNNPEPADKDKNTDKEDDDDDAISREAEECVVPNEFKEKVVKYVKIDNLIRQKDSEAKLLKGERKKFEEYIIRYLDKVKEVSVEIGDGQLVKNETVKKKPINTDIIKEAITEKIKEDKLFKDDKEREKAVEDILELMEKKRPQTTNVKLDRKFNNKEKKKNPQKGKKGKKGKADKTDKPADE